MNILFDYATIKAGKRHLLSNPITDAFNRLSVGAEAAGYNVIRRDTIGDYDNISAVFVFGSITQRKTETERSKAILQHREKGTPIFSLDSAFFSTYIREKFQTSETGMFRIGFNDCTGTGSWFNKSSPADRYENFKQHYGFEEKPTTADNDAPILFLLQSEKGWQYDNTEPYYIWARKTVEQIRERTDRKIILRAHPNLDRNPTEFIAKGFDNIEIERCGRERRGLIDTLQRVGCTVTHSSSAAIESYVEGKPTFTLDPRCVVFDETENSLNKINSLELYNWYEREQNLHNWAYTSWHVTEMMKPEVVNRYLKHMEWVRKKNNESKLRSVQ